MSIPKTPVNKHKDQSGFSAGTPEWTIWNLIYYSEMMKASHGRILREQSRRKVEPIYLMQMSIESNFCMRLVFDMMSAAPEFVQQCLNTMHSPAMKELFDKDTESWVNSVAPEKSLIITPEFSLGDANIRKKNGG